jgi:hypothetical protein
VLKRPGVYLDIYSWSSNWWAGFGQAGVGRTNNVVESHSQCIHEEANDSIIHHPVATIYYEAAIRKRFFCVVGGSIHERHELLLLT